MSSVFFKVRGFIEGFFKKVFLERSMAQGTIEYLLVVGVVVVVGLVAVGVLSGVGGSGDFERRSSSVSWLGGSVALVEGLVDGNGEWVLAVRNNGQETIFLSSIVVDGVVFDLDGFSLGGFAERVFLFKNDFSIDSCVDTFKAIDVSLKYVSRYGVSNVVSNNYKFYLDCVEEVIPNDKYVVFGDGVVVEDEVPPSLLMDLPKFEWEYGCSLGTDHNFLGSFCDDGDLDTVCIIDTPKNISNNVAIYGSGKLVVVDGGVLNTNAEHFFTMRFDDGIEIESGGIITGNIREACTPQDFIINGNINTNQKGFVGSTGGAQSGLGPGAGGGIMFTYNGGGGAGHGGVGGNGSGRSNGGLSYGVLEEPVLLGSGGGADNGGSGGGVVRLVVGGNLNISGFVSADGGSGTGTRGGGGSGGSVWISANSLSGNGFVSVNGGSGAGTGGGGSGGRIAVYFDEDVSDLSFSAFGGTGDQTGQLGTIHLIN